MKFYALLFVIFLTNIQLFSVTSLDTLSIKGDIKFLDNTVQGNFAYTIKNNEVVTKEEWIFLIHPSINISSVSQNNVQAKVAIQQGVNYRILTVTLPQEIPANGRTSVLVNFSIPEQNNNPRMLVQSNFVFLDARQFWFPYPLRDNQADFEITVTTPQNLTSIMGGKLNQNTIIVDKRLSTWENELKDLSPSASLIIMDTPKQNKDSIYLYSSNNKVFSIIDKQFSPLWDQLKKKHRVFPLSEIHIIPLAISIPNHIDKDVEGEFLGNIFLLNTPIIDLINNNTNDQTLWTKPSEQLVETLIHELYHSFFPGIVQHDRKDSLFIESLVQYLTWDLINTSSPIWGDKISRRTRYYIQNIYRKQQLNYLWDYLQDSSLLFGFTHKVELDGITLADTLVEKYKSIEYTKLDVYETIYQHGIKQEMMKLTNETIIVDYTTNLFENPIASTPKKLFNSSIKAIKTNFNVFVTNTTFFKRQKIIAIPVNASFLSIAHNYPFEWFGQLKWVENNNTNILDIKIPKNTIWETNLIGDINYIQTKSPLDIIENRLYDNIISDNDVGKKIIYLLNTSKTIEGLNISISSKAQVQLTSLINNKQILQWDSSFYSDHDKILINAFILNKNQKNSYITIPVNIDKDVYIIDTFITN